MSAAKCGSAWISTDISRDTLTGFCNPRMENRGFCKRAERARRWLSVGVWATSAIFPYSGQICHLDSVPRGLSTLARVRRPTRPTRPKRSILEVNRRAGQEFALPAPARLLASRPPAIQARHPARGTHRRMLEAKRSRPSVRGQILL